MHSPGMEGTTPRQIEQHPKSNRSTIPPINLHINGVASTYTLIFAMHISTIFSI